MNAKVKGLTAVTAVTLAALLGLAGCSGSSSNDNSQSGGGVGREPTTNGEKAPSAYDSTGGGTGGSTDRGNGQPAAPAVATRSIIYSGDMTVRAKDVNGTAERITQMIATTGGFVGSDQRSSSDTASTTATMVLRIPADRFGDTVDAISKLPDVDELNRSFAQQDVTAQVVDLDARIGAAQVSIARLKELMAGAASTSDLLTISNELSRIEGDLASLQAQRDKLKDLVSLSTLTVTLLGPAAPLPPDKDDTGFLVGLKNGWHAFTRSVEVVVTVIGAALPFAIAIGVPVFALLWWSRRRRASRRGAPATAPIHPAYGNAPAAGMPVGARAGNPPAAQAREPEQPTM
jgi:hypothetical protein